MPTKTDPPLNILLVDDHRLVREGIKAILHLNNAGVQFIFDEAESTEEAIRRVSARAYDVILLDYCLPGIEGHTAAAIILKLRPSSRILALSSYPEKSYVNRMMAAGVMGYVVKSVDPDSLVDAIKAVLRNEKYYSNEIAQKLINDNFVPAQAAPLQLLTAREKDIFQLLLKAKTTREIAGRFGISSRTVDKHRQNLMRKLKVKNAVELGEVGGRLNLIS